MSTARRKAEDLSNSSVRPAPGLEEGVAISGWSDAVQRNRGEEVRALLERGLDVNATLRPGVTMLQLAVQAGSDDVVALLIEKGADVNVAGGDPLLEAAAHPKPEIVRLLIEAGANVNARTPGGYTALIIAAGRGYTESVKLLLSAGADVEARGGSERTAAQLAGERGYAETQEAITLHIAASAPSTKHDPAGASPTQDGETYTESGLMWQVAEDGEERTYGEAVSYCQMLELGGHDDWRLPRTEELQGLARLGSEKLRRLFPKIQEERYWAACRAEELSWAERPEKIAYTVDFDPGSSNFGKPITYYRTYRYFVRAARDIRGGSRGSLGSTST